MSLIIAALVLTSTAPQDAAPGRPGQWRQLAALSDLGRDEVRNRVSLEGDSLIWNGAPITETQLRTYLDITTQLKPGPLLVFSHSAQASPVRVSAVRSLIDDILQCTPAICSELTPRP